jgi:hypothetical protein
MNDQLLSTFFSAVIGGFVGMFFSLFLPRFLFDPRIKITGISQHGHVFRLTVVNKGRTAANDAVGRLTIRPIGKDDIGVTKEQVIEARKTASVNDDWRKTSNSHLRAEDWELGIEMENLFWAGSGGMHHKLNPELPEALVVGYSEGEWIDIASEHTNIKRTRLILDKDKVYFGEVVIGASNCRPSKPFRFQIFLAENKMASMKPFNGKLPSR